MEHDILSRRSVSAKFGDMIATQAGKMWFIMVHVVWFLGWIVAQQMLRFDPSFTLLTMLVSLESIFLSLFIIMSQNRSNLQADQRNHLDLQINLLSEHENTKMIQMLQAICEYHRLAIGTDPEIVALSQRTDLKLVVQDLQNNLPTADLE